MARLRVDYRLPELLEGRLDHVEIEGLTVRAAWRDGSLHLAGIESTDGSGAAPPLPDVEQVTLRDALLDLSTDLGALQVPLSAQVRTIGERLVFEATVDGARLDGIEGSLVASGTFDGGLPRGASVAIDRARAQGNIALVAMHAALGMVQGIDGEASLGLELAEGRLQVETSDLALTLAGVEMGPDLESALPPPWQVQVDQSAPLHLDARFDSTMTFEGGLAMTTGGPRADLQLDLGLTLDDQELRLAPSSAHLAMFDVAWQGAALGEAQIELTGEGSMQAAHGTLGLQLSDGTVSAPDLTVDGASLHQQLDWSRTADALTLHLGEPGSLAIDSLAGPDLLGGSAQLRLEPTDRPLLELTLQDGRPAAWRQSVAAVIERLEAHLAAPAALDLESEAGLIDVALEGAGQALGHGEVRLTGGRLQLPGYGLTLGLITGQAALTADGLALDQAIPLSVERISHAGRPAWFAPLALQGEIVPKTDNLAFEGVLNRIGGGLQLDVRGEVLRSGGGQATVELAPVSFDPQLQPHNLAPVVADAVTDVSGKLALDGDLAWGDAGITSDLALLVDQLGFTSGPARLEQVNGVVRLDRLWPPTTPPGQQLAIGLLDLGLPLTDGITTFQVTDGPRLEVEQLQWHLAGGTARAEPFSLGSPLSDLNVTLRAGQLDLGQLLALTRMDGLSGEGSLNGVLPVRVSEGAAIIENGELAATGPGVLRYASAAAPAALQAGGEGVDLLLQALENFHYEALKITLEGRTDAAMDIGLHLAGANPDLYDGHPVEFNLDLEGDLADILRQGVASYQIPDRIRERMQGFGR